MQILRTVIWVLLLILLLLFSINNWTTTEVKIWEGLNLVTKLPALVVIAFLLGLVPMWLIHRASKWRMARRITALEASVRAATPAVVAPVAATHDKVVDGFDDTTHHTPVPPPPPPPPSTPPPSTPLA